MELLSHIKSSKFVESIPAQNITYLKAIVPADVMDWQRARPEFYGTKLPKTLKGFEIGTEKQAELKRWAAHNRYRIGQVTGTIWDPIVLQKIAELIGYKEEVK